MPFTLLHPALFAFGIACVSIPIILHLLKRKRRPIPWGAMRFLEQAYKKRRRILTIEQLILLFLRCILIALIAMGVGSLMLGSGLQRSIPTTMVIVIDQSIGSALVYGDEMEIEKNKRFAMQMIEELEQSRGDRVMLISAGRPAKGLVVPETTDFGSVRSIIETLDPIDSGFDLQQSLVLAQQMENDPSLTTRHVLVIAASGRGTSLMDLEPESRARFDRVFAMQPAQEEVGNIGIESVNVNRSLVTHSGVSLPMGVQVNLIRSGIESDLQDQSERATSSIQVFDQKSKLIGDRRIRWEIGQTQATVIVAINPDSIEPIGARTSLLRVLIDDDANLRDNEVVVPVSTRRVIRVGVIDQVNTLGESRSSRAGSIASSRWVRAALAPDESFGVSILDIDASRAASSISGDLDALVVLSPGQLDDAAWERIASLHEGGSLVMITPDRDGGSIDWLDRVEQLMSGATTDNIFDGSFKRDFENPMSLDTSLPDGSTNLLGSLSGEYASLSRSVRVTQAVQFSSQVISSDSENGQEVVEDGRLPILTLDDGSVLALEFQPRNLELGGRRGFVVVFGFAFDLDWTNLPARPMFVPMMQEILRQGVGRGSMMPSIIAGDRVPSQAWVVSEKRLHLDHEDPTLSSSGDEMTRAGVIAQYDSQGTTRGFVVIHPDSKSSTTTISNNEELIELLIGSIDVETVEWVEQGMDGDESAQNSSRSALDHSAGGVSFALWMLLAAGIIAILEFILAKLFTTNVHADTVHGSSATQLNQAGGTR
ncbi:MAG: BatA domain-containing protein [Phycisphaerales bacterium]|nr:BatA domain-containing protein [Phycisphaerales bacterium]